MAKSWSDDPKTWIAIIMISSVASAVATAYVTRALNLQVAEMKAKLESAGLSA